MWDADYPVAPPFAWFGVLRKIVFLIISSNKKQVNLYLLCVDCAGKPLFSKNKLHLFEIRSQSFKPQHQIFPNMLSCTIAYRNEKRLLGLMLLLPAFLLFHGATAQDTIAGRVYTIHPSRHTTSAQPGVKMRLFAGGQTIDSCFTDINGHYHFLAEGNCSNLRVEPTPEGLPLPQPDCWDAVLMMQHLLGIQPFTTRNQLLQADMNRSGTITTFDALIVRHKIFGLENKETKELVWRFYDAALPENEKENFLDGNMPGYRILTEKMVPANNVDFVACPPGEMKEIPENEHIAHTVPDVLRVEGPMHPANDLLQYSIYFDGPAPALAAQFALHFDQEAMTLISPAPVLEGGITAANFDLSKAGNGHIGFVWHATDAEQIPLDSGRLLFHLVFKITTAQNRPVLELAAQTAPAPAAWSPEGQKNLLQPVYKSVPETIPELESLFVRQQTPGGQVTLLISDTHPGKARVVILGAFGERLSLRDIVVEGGPQEIALPEADALKTGVYHWWVKVPYGHIYTGHFVKR